ncbi:MAG: FHA domain-containing protein [Pseudomonadota bacterium]
MLDKQLLEILVCPQCKGELSQADAGKALLCDVCKFKYPIREDIPIMIAAQAIDLRKGDAKHKSALADLPKVEFKIIAGSDKGLKFHLERGACRAIGRGEAQADRTMIFNVDIALSIDESTKALILRYINKQFRNNFNSSIRKQEKDQLGFFSRGTDIVLTDHSLSRLHAMFFAAENAVGILDLVSKNGTFVNGKEIESQLLTKGDIIEMGETRISFEG